MVKSLTVHLSPSEKSILEENDIVKNEIHTIKHLKAHLKLDDSEILEFMFQNSQLHDLTLIEELGDYPEIFVVKSIETNNISMSDSSTCATERASDIGFNANFEIEDSSSRISTEAECQTTKKMLKIKVDGSTKEVSHDRVFIKEGKTYLIVKQTRKYPLRNSLAQITSSLSRDTLSNMALLSIILMTKNYVLITIVLFLRAFMNISNIVRDSKVYKMSENSLYKKVFMFFASLFIIEHDRLHLDASS